MTDLEILEKIKSCMKYTGPIHIINKINKKHKIMYDLRITNVKICRDLLKLDIIPKKTFLTQFPTFDKVPIELIRHYIRGIMDSDGSVYFNCQYKKSIRVCIAGTPTLLIPMIDFIKNSIGVKFGIGNCYNNKTQTIRTSGSYAMKFLEWLYKDSTIYLERKFNRYKEL